MLGRYHRKRYTEDYKFLSPDLNPNEVLMMSDIGSRIIQSGYSELMGLYPPGKSGAEKLTQGMIDCIQQNTTTPFKIRDADKINS